INPATGVLSWTATNAQLGSHPVVVSVVDTRGLRDSLSFDLTVVASAPNDPPLISSTPRTAIRLGNTYLYQVIASDPNNDALHISLIAFPTGMTLESGNLLTWTPAPTQPGQQ